MMNLKDYRSNLNLNDFAEDYRDYSGYIGDIISEIADYYVSNSTATIKDFIANNVDYVEDAIKEFGWDGCGKDLYKAAQIGEWMKNEEELYNCMTDDLMNYAINRLIDNDHEELDDPIFDELESFINGLDNNDELEDIDNWIDENIINSDDEE